MDSVERIPIVYSHPLKLSPFSFCVSLRALEDGVGPHDAYYAPALSVYICPVVNNSKSSCQWINLLLFFLCWKLFTMLSKKGQRIPVMRKYTQEDIENAIQKYRRYDKLNIILYIHI